MKTLVNIFCTISLITLCGAATAETKRASELYKDLAPKKRDALKKEMKTNNISQQDLEEIEIEVDGVNKSINVDTNKDITKKQALFLALRLGFPLLAGIGVVYRNESTVPFNVTLNIQTVILATSYNAAIAWNFYKGFFIGPTAHLIRTNNVWSSPQNENRFFYGAQIGYQHAFGETKRWYIDGRLELLKAEGDAFIPNANIGFGVRLW